METRLGTQLNGDATFGFCSSNVDMISFGFNSMGSVNNPACWSFIPHQVEGQRTYTLTFYELQRVVISLLKANTAKECPFTTCLKELLTRPNVQKYIQGALCRDGKLDFQTAQCDQLAGWASYTHKVSGMDANTCSNHLTGTLHLFSRWIFPDPLFLSGIAAQGYHHVNYFDGPTQREHYDDFFGKALQVNVFPLPLTFRPCWWITSVIG
jgi:hypothetical protein